MVVASEEELEEGMELLDSGLSLIVRLSYSNKVLKLTKKYQQKGIQQ